MGRGPLFIDRAVFEEMLQAAGRVNGQPYQDVTTIYGDLSRLVVALLATTPREQLDELYARGGWRQSANTRAIHEAAKQWLRTYHPDKVSPGEAPPRQARPNTAPYVTYENRANPHVTIHRGHCSQIAKHGGQHQYGQGGYAQHESYDHAEAYARTTELPLKICSFCKPSAGS